ncbi:MAG: hypothetical protein US52_C0061G0004 [candidate division WS6 bacterium GW2011_GWA2_37_6]|uniref:Uncharacterized protein n=1 Tax=candidate division WS6 bacterium GW2011_GWA2_37_6 TaxID=1619087 RepID=A0A0G0H762_9BACT|nr:MAG: hypothetical protein US52_C0061G0004 [candidate division WS6 bacterium GW2011_GWA2_37_6]
MKGVEIAQTLWRFWLYAFIYLNIWPMLSHLFSPMFQDKSWTGRMVAFPIRLIWVFVGLIIQAGFMVVGLVFGAIYFIFPLLPIVEVVYYLINCCT